MFELPLHPAVVHIPLALAFVLPILSIVFLLLFKRGRLQKSAWVLIVVLHVLLTAGSFAGLQTGERDEDKVEQVLPKIIIHQHEEQAETFMVLTVVALLFSLISLFTKTERHFNISVYIILALQIVVLGAGLVVGHSGGELMYKHGAAEAYVEAPNK